MHSSCSAAIRRSSVACSSRRRFRPATAERQDVIETCSCRLVDEMGWEHTPRSRGGRRVDAGSLIGGPCTVASILADRHRARLADHRLDPILRRAKPRERCGLAAVPVPRHRASDRPPGWLPGVQQNERIRTASLFRAFPWWKRRELNPRPSDYESDALPIELLFMLRSPIIRPTHAVRWLVLARRTGV